MVILNIILTVGDDTFLIHLPLIHDDVLCCPLELLVGKGRAEALPASL